MSYIYESSEKLVTRVNQQLRSYQEANYIDPVRFSYLLRAGLHDLGIANGTRQVTTLNLVNGKSKLPTGLSKVEYVSVTEREREYYIKPFEVSATGYKLDPNYIYLPLQDTALTLGFIGDIAPEELPFVPTDPIIQTYLEKKLIFELIREWYLNSDDTNLERKLQLVTQEFEVSYRSALHAVKLPSPEQLHNYRTRTRRRVI